MTGVDRAASDSLVGGAHPLLDLSRIEKKALKKLEAAMGAQE